MKTLITRLVREDDGQDLIEYAVVGGLVAVASIAAITAIGGDIRRIFLAVGAKLAAITVN